MAPINCIIKVPKDGKRANGGWVPNQSRVHVNFDVDKVSFAEVRRLSQEDEVSVSQKFRELLELALITLEDES